MVPERIVCLAAEIPEILFRLGALDRVVGISAYTTQPAAALHIEKVSGFSHGSVDRIMRQNPDLVILTSGVQKELSSRLAERGAPLLHLNPHRLSDLYHSIQLIGNIVGESEKAAQLCTSLHVEFQSIAEKAGRLPAKPRVYFEEWMDPLICGTGWVSDLITLAGGVDVCREMSTQGRSASERMLPAEAVIALNPDIVFASWCGKPFERSSFVSRPGYGEIAAVRHHHVYEVDSRILQVGPQLVESAKELYEHFLRWNER